MKTTILKFSAFLLLISLMGAGCEKEGKSEYSKGQILAITCGGTVIQFLNATHKVGEKWSNNFSNPVKSYENCVLTGDFLVGEYNEGDIIYFDYKEVEILDGDFCDIGGLPASLIEIIELYENCPDC